LHWKTDRQAASLISRSKERSVDFAAVTVVVRHRRTAAAAAAAAADVSDQATVTAITDAYHR